MDKFSELIKLDLNILKDKMGVLRKESLNLRFQKSSGQLEKTARISVVKKQIARIKTAINFNIKFEYLIKFYLQSFISNLINVCVKHIPISQKDGQKLNVIFINKIQDFLQKSEKLNLEDIGSTFFIGDLFSIKHENLETRIYLT